MTVVTVVTVVVREKENNFFTIKKNFLNNYIFPSFFWPKKFHKKNSTTQIVMKLKNSNCDETQKLNFFSNSKTQIMMKLKNSNCDQTPKLKLWWNSKNSNCDKNKKIKLWWNSKNQIVKKTHVLTKLKLWQKSNEKTQKIYVTKLKLWQNSRTQTMTKQKNQFVTKLKNSRLWQNLNYDKFQFMKKKTLKGSFSKNT